MSVDKKLKYDVQGGVKNYKPSKMVTAPKKAKSSPNHPATELAYITKAEKDLLIKQNLHGSLKGKPNKGPSGIMSLDGGYNEPGGFQSGGNQSAAESGDTGAFGGGAENEQNARDTRSATINAGAGQRVNPGFFDSRNVISPEEVAMAKDYRNQNNIQGTVAKNAYNKTRGGTLGNFIGGGGILGAGIRGLGNMFGLGKTYDQPTNDMSGYNSLGLGGTGQEGFGVPTQQGDYDMLGNKINEITGEITSPTGQSLGTIPGYPGGPGSDGGGITTLPQNGSDQYVNLIDQYVPDDPAIPNDAFSQRFKVKDEFRKAKGNDLRAEDKTIQKMIEELYT